MALKLQILLEAVDRLTAPIARVQARVAALGRTAGADRLAASMQRVAGGATEAAAALAVVAGRTTVLVGALAGAGFAFNRAFVRPTAALENIEAVLVGTEGSAQAARAALRWVQDFAERTPYQIGQVADAFRMLRSMGIDAQSFLEPIGDAAANTGKPLSQAVEAFADAMTGEFERLKEFGIITAREGNRVMFEYVANGQRIRRRANARDRAELQRTLAAIWSQQHAGGMMRQSRTWDGMVSNLQDRWTRFATAVMDNGVFDWMKTRLDRLNRATGQMAADGSMQTWAQATAASILRVFDATERLLLGYDRMLNADTASEMGGLATERVPGLFERMGQIGKAIGDAFAAVRGAVEGVTGPLDNVDIALGAIGAWLAGPLIPALLRLGAAFVALGKAFAFTPLGRIVTLVVALGAAGVWLYRNWDGVLEWFRQQWEALPQPVQDAIRIITAPIRGLVELVDLLAAAWERAAAAMGRYRAQPTPNDVAPPGTPERQRRSRSRWVPDGPSLDDLPDLMEGGASPMSFGGAGRVDTGGVLRIRIEDGRVAATGRMNDPRTRLDVDQGLLMGSA